MAEEQELSPAQRAALRKVFEEDTFIEGMMDIRQVSEHVTKRGGPVIRDTSNAPMVVQVTVSAGSMFAAPVVRVPQTIDHMKLLEEAERRFSAAIAKAKAAE